jgi:hypothetical protein
VVRRLIADFYGLVGDVIDPQEIDEQELVPVRATAALGARASAAPRRPS